jgi:hypothetical protein
MVALWFAVPSRGLVAVSATTATTAAPSATATAVATSTAAAGFAGLGFVYLKSPTSLILAVHSRNRRLSLRIGAHLHESEALTSPRVAIHDHFRTLDGPVRRQQRLQVRAADIIAKVPDIQFFAHRNLLSMA